MLAERGLGCGGWPAVGTTVELTVGTAVETAAAAAGFAAAAAAATVSSMRARLWCRVTKPIIRCVRQARAVMT
jgi:hypothetical protein